MDQFLKSPGLASKSSTYFAAIAFVVIGTLVSGSLASQGYLMMTGIHAKSTQELTTILSKNEWLMLNLFPFVCGFLWAIFVAKQFFKRSFSSFLTLRNQFDYNRFFFAFGIWLFVLMLLLIVQYFTDPTSLQLNAFSFDSVVLLVISLLMVPLQTGLEEVVFRGYFFQLLGKFTTKGILVVLVNGCVFGALHWSNPEVQSLGWVAIFFYVISGIFTAFMTLMDDGMELAWGFHFANNFFGILIVTNSIQVVQTNAIFTSSSATEGNWSLVIATLCFYPILLLIFAKRFQWTNWKNRLFGL